MQLNQWLGGLIRHGTMKNRADQLPIVGPRGGHTPPPPMRFPASPPPRQPPMFFGKSANVSHRYFLKKSQTSPSAHRRSASSHRHRRGHATPRARLPAVETVARGEQQPRRDGGRRCAVAAPKPAMAIKGGVGGSPPPRFKTTPLAWGINRHGSLAGEVGSGSRRAVPGMTTARSSPSHDLPRAGFIPTGCQFLRPSTAKPAV
jgi:hypothetical protein